MSALLAPTWHGLALQVLALLVVACGGYAFGRAWGAVLDRMRVQHRSPREAYLAANPTIHRASVRMPSPSGRAARAGRNRQTPRLGMAAPLRAWWNPLPMFGLRA